MAENETFRPSDCIAAHKPYNDKLGYSNESERSSDLPKEDFVKLEDTSYVTHISNICNNNSNNNSTKPTESGFVDSNTPLGSGNRPTHHSGNKVKGNGITEPGSSNEPDSHESHTVCITTQHGKNDNVTCSTESVFLKSEFGETEDLKECKALNINDKNKSNNSATHDEVKDVPLIKTHSDSCNEVTEPIAGSSSDLIKHESSEDHAVWLPSTKIKAETEDNDSKLSLSEEDEDSEEEVGEEERLEEEDSDAEMDEESNGGAYHLAEVSYGEENEDSQKAEGMETNSGRVSHDIKKSASRRIETSDDLSPEGQLASDFIIRRKNVKVTDLKSGKVHYKNFECLICGYKAPQRSSLIDHIHKHTGEKIHHCLHCDKKFRYKSYLTQHITIYHTDFQAQYSCKLCGRRFVKESAFVRHERTHSGERPFPCDFCNYQARHRGALKEHLRTHTGEKPYKCSECSYTCAYSTLLKRHVAKHHEEKTFSCQYCKYVTKQMRNFNDHLKTHTGDKFYHCDNCSYKSIRKDSLKAHITHVHSNESLTCTVCNAKFKYRKRLSKHTYEHHPDKFPFKCELCNLRFKRPRGLALHNRKRHPQEQTAAT